MSSSNDYLSLQVNIMPAAGTFLPSLQIVPDHQWQAFAATSNRTDFQNVVPSVVPGPLYAIEDAPITAIDVLESRLRLLRQ